MSERRTSVFLAAFFAATCVAACGNDATGGGPSGSGGALGTGGTPGMAGAPAGGGGSAGSSCMTITTDPKYAKNSCNNVTDKCYFEKNAALAYTAGGKCATMDCASFAIQPETEAAKQCFTECFQREMKAQTGSSASDACALCSDAVVICGAFGCLNQCLSDPSSADCLTCLCSVHPANGGNPQGSCLIDAFANCAGFAPPPELVGCKP